jgi:hypothetical protein
MDSRRNSDPIELLAACDQKLLAIETGEDLAAYRALLNLLMEQPSGLLSAQAQLNHLMSRLRLEAGDGGPGAAVDVRLLAEAIKSIQLHTAWNTDIDITRDV